MMIKLITIYFNICVYFVYFSDYNNQTDLHIAVTTSSGTIVEFDRHGLRRHAPKDFNKSLWEQSLLVECVPEPWYDHWDDVLSKVKLKAPFY